MDIRKKLLTLQYNIVEQQTQTNMEKDRYKGQHTIVNTDVCQFEYDDYLDYCEDMGDTPDEENSEAYWDWCYEEMGLNFDSDMENIKYCKSYNTKVRLNGSLGLWDGSHKIEEYVFDSVYDAIVKCNSANCDHILRVVWEDGIIKVLVSHHDGTNYFEIHPYDRRKKLPYLYNIGVN